MGCLVEHCIEHDLLSQSGDKPPGAKALHAAYASKAGQYVGSW